MRRRGKVELWPTAMEWRRDRNGQLVGKVTAWGPKPGRPEPEPQLSRRGAIGQGALDL